MTQQVISISGLTKKFGSDVVLNDMSMNVEKGDIYGLLGPNGVGKTTTIKIMLGLLYFDKGDVVILGECPIKNGVHLRQRVNALPENYGMYGWMSAREYLKLFLNLYGYKNNDEIFKKLTEVGLDPMDKKPIQYFSHGMKRRLGIARALINNPELIFLDEPTNGLDPRGRREIHNLLLNLNKKTGMTIIISTHILDDVERLCNKIGILFDGGLKYEDSILNKKRESPSEIQFKLENNEVPISVFKELGIPLIEKKDNSVTCAINHSAISETLKALILKDVPIIEVEETSNKIEDLYIKYTRGY